MIPSSSREVQSVRTAFRLVALLQDMDGATMSDLTAQLDLAKSTVHNYLGTLASLGYVVERDGVYHLGLRFLTHGMAAKSGLALQEAVTHILPGVSRTLSQPTWWIVEELGRGVFVEKAAPADSTPIYGRVGKRSYLHTHAPGKAILARLPEDHVQAIVDHHGLPVLTRETTTDPDELAEELADIRDRGYAVSDGGAALGIRSVGIGFEGPYGYTHGLGVFGHSHDFGVSSEQDIPSVLHDAADEIGTVASREGRE
jgi:DNA-binding IclR family transcriptional regulator